jgi:hypothetical protein
MDDRQKLQRPAGTRCTCCSPPTSAPNAIKPGHHDEILENGFLRDVLRRMKALLEEA